MSQRIYISNANGDWWVCEGKAELLHVITEDELTKAIAAENEEPCDDPQEYDVLEHYIHKYGRTTTVHLG